MVDRRGRRHSVHPDHGFRRFHCFPAAKLNRLPAPVPRQTGAVDACLVAPAVAATVPVALAVAPAAGHHIDPLRRCHSGVTPRRLEQPTPPSSLQHDIVVHQGDPVAAADRDAVVRRASEPGGPRQFDDPRRPLDRPRPRRRKPPAQLAQDRRPAGIPGVRRVPCALGLPGPRRLPHDDQFRWPIEPLTVPVDRRQALLQVLRDADRRHDVRQRRRCPSAGCAGLLTRCRRRRLRNARGVSLAPCSLQPSGPPS